MKSSQALAQSVFANLKHFEKLNILSGLNGSDGKLLSKTICGVSSPVFRSGRSVYMSMASQTLG